MRLNSFQIKNFKSIADTGRCSVSAQDNIIVLAGQNEAGKSAVIEALDFFRNGPTPRFQDLQQRRGANAEVLCEFSLEDADLEGIPSFGEDAKVMSFFKANQILTFSRRRNMDDTKYVFIWITSPLQMKFIDGMQTQIDKEANRRTLEAGATVPNASTESSEATPKVEVLKELRSYFFNRLRPFVYYSSFDSFLPKEVSLGGVESLSSVQDFQKVFKVDFADILNGDARSIKRAESQIMRMATSDLNKYWTQHMEIGGEYEFQIKITKFDPVEDSTIEFFVEQGDQDPLYFEQKSTGFKWFSAFNLRLRAHGVEESEIRNLVILIDEPGQGLHEKAQRDLKKVLEELAGAGAQLIYTTHYPNLIGTQGAEFSRIRLVTKNATSGTKVSTIAQYSSGTGTSSLDALSPIIIAMGIQNVGSLMSDDGLNVVVEGISDHYYLSALAKILRRGEGIRFIPATGANNVTNLVSVLFGWGHNFKAVFDDDANTGRKAYNALKKAFFENDDERAHEAILKLTNCHGIEDLLSQSDFHKHVLQSSDPVPSTTSANSTLAKSKKEALGRLFLERAETQTIDLDETSRKAAQEVFEWLEA